MWSSSSMNVNLLFLLLGCLTNTISALSSTTTTTTGSTTTTTEATTNIHGSIVFSDLLPSGDHLHPLTRVHLRNSERDYVCVIHSSGYFSLRGVVAGEYVLGVTSLHHAFTPLRIDVSPPLAHQPKSESESKSGPLLTRDDGGEKETEDDGELTIRAYKTSSTIKFSQPGARVTYPLRIASTGRVEYYLDRPGFDPLGMVKNPMVLLGLVMAFSVFGLPALTKYLDPEGVREMQRIRLEKAEEAKTQEPLENPMEKLRDFDVTGWLAGKK